MHKLSLMQYYRTAELATQFRVQIRCYEANSFVLWSMTLHERYKVVLNRMRINIISYCKQYYKGLICNVVRRYKNIYVMITNDINQNIL